MNNMLIDQERSVLGTVMISPEALQRIGSTLKAEDFFLKEHQDIYKVIENLKAARKDVNVMSVGAVLERGKSDVSREFLDDLTSYYVDAEAATTFSSQITEAAGVRFFGRAIEVITKDISSGAMELPEVVSSLNKLTTQLASKSFAPTEKYGEFLEQSFMRLFNIQKSAGRLIGIPEIDNKIYSFNPGEIVVIAARPGMGKTAWMLQSARVQIEDGKTVGFITLEMPEEQLLQRLVASTSGTPGDVLLKMSEEEFFSTPELVSALKFYIQNEQLIVDTGAPNDIDTIERVIRKMKYVHGVDVIYIDYLQLIEPSPFDKRTGNRNNELSTISRRLKILAMELQIQLMTGSQLTRESDRRGSGPMLRDLRDSGAIEQDASLVMFLYSIIPETISEEQRDQYVNSASELTIKVEIGKQRNGPLWVFDAIFVKPIGKFISTKDSMINQIDNRWDQPLAH